MPFHASQMYARTVTNYLLHLLKDGKPQLDLDDELTRGPLVTHQGEVVHEAAKAALAAPPVDALRFVAGPPVGAPAPRSALDVPRRAADETFRATFGALSAIALPIFGAFFETWSPAARTALPTNVSAPAFAHAPVCNFTGSTTAKLSFARKSFCEFKYKFALPPTDCTTNCTVTLGGTCPRVKSRASWDPWIAIGTTGATMTVVVPAGEILARLDAAFGLEAPDPRGSAPAERYRYRDGRGAVGVIASVTRAFCAQCDRIRLTADGQVRTCLFATTEHDLRAVLRSGAGDEAVAQVYLDAVARKQWGHRINEADFVQPARGMSQIGG